MTKSSASITEIPEFVTNATKTLQEYSDKPLFTITISQWADLAKFLQCQSQSVAIVEPLAEAPKFLTRKETSALLHLSLPTLDKYTNLGIIHGQRVGSRILYKDSAIEEACKTIEKKKYKR